MRAYVRALSHVTVTFLWSQGWVKSVRKHKRYVFIDLNDGSSLKDLQIVAPVDEFPMYVKLYKSLTECDVCIIIIMSYNNK